MRKINIDSHYNHELNKYGKNFVLELNNMVFKHLDEESENHKTKWHYTFHEY